MPEQNRESLWQIYEKLRAHLQEIGLTTRSALFNTLSEMYQSNSQTPFDFVVLDEAQDVSVAQLRFLASLAGNKANGLFFAGDLGQRIFQPPFSWKSLGVDVRGRSFTLRINYRTSHQIRMHADRLLPSELSDVDGNKENRKGTISVFNGPNPFIRDFDSDEDEIAYVAEWVKEKLSSGLNAEEIGVFVRSEAELDRARQALEAAGLTYKVIDEHFEMREGFASISTMHFAKGLEFRAVVVMACDDEVIPLQLRIETASDTSEIEEIYSTERHLLYVACARARDYLLITGLEPLSEFVDDLKIAV